MSRSSIQTSRYRICSSQIIPWVDSWLGFRWGKCVECGSVQKLISKDQFEALGASYDPGYLASGEPSPELLRQNMGVDKKYRLLRRLIGADPNGSLLDIGCGMGGYLLAGRQMGLDVLGVEPSASHSKAAVDIFGLDVVHDYFKAEAFDQRFNYVILSHVIEHIYEPKEFLADVMRVLQPGGRLIVITPNCESFSAKICRKYWSMYKPIDHVSMFSKDAMESSLPEGAAIERLETNEWPGEFAAHIISAIKTAWRPTVGNVGNEKLGGPYRQTNLGILVRVCLAVMSWPFYALGGPMDRRSCLYAVIKKNNDF